MELIEDFANLSTGDGFFERAYRNEFDQIIRMRFQPVQLEPENRAYVNVPQVPTQISLFVSASLVGEDGQVILFNGRAVVTERSSETISFDGDGTIDVEAILLDIATRYGAVVRRRAEIASSAGLLIAGPLEPDILIITQPPMEPPPPTPTVGQPVED